MKYVLALAFFTQLSWSADEIIKRTQDFVDIAAESACKDHSDPEICRTEFKATMSAILIYQIHKNFPGTFGLSHQIFLSNDSEAAIAKTTEGTLSTVNYLPEGPGVDISQFCETYYSKQLEDCLSGFSSTEDSLEKLRNFIGSHYKQ